MINKIRRFFFGEPPLKAFNSYWIEWENCRLPSGFYLVKNASKNWLTLQRIGNACDVIVPVKKVSCVIGGDPHSTKLWNH